MPTAKTDTDTTKVVFLIDDETLTPFAYFPDLEYNDQANIKTGYAHIGQHTAVHKYYAMNCKLATEAEYNELKEELLSLGYNLDIQKSKRCI